MTRTTIMLPDSVKKRAEEEARSSGISFAEFVRQSIESGLSKATSDVNRKKRSADSLFIGLESLACQSPISCPTASTRYEDELYGSISLVAEDPKP